MKKKEPLKSAYGLSIYLSSYLKTLKDTKRNEVYETILLMILNKQILITLEELIKKNIEGTKEKEGFIDFKVFSSESFLKQVDDVCNSKYFRENLSAGEIERKRYIMQNVMLELSTYSIINTFAGRVEGYKGFARKDGITITIDSTELDRPLIEHTCKEKNGLKEFTMTFNEGTALNDIAWYLKNILDIKNNPSRKKLSLGKGYRLLAVENEIKQNIGLYSDEKFEYVEQLVSRKMKAMYNEDMSFESISKLLQRMKKIEKEINTA